MTIKDFLDGIPNMKSDDGTTLKDTMMQTVSIWTNDACKGYIILAMQEAGYDRDKIKEAFSKLRYVFDDYTVEAAEQVYRDF